MLLNQIIYQMICEGDSGNIKFTVVFCLLATQNMQGDFAFS